MNRFDWPAMMRVALHELKLKPDEFWGLTPLEFLMISGLEGHSSVGMTRADLAGLCARFPDAKME